MEWSAQVGVVMVMGGIWIGAFACGGSENPTLPTNAVEDMEFLAFVDQNADGLSFNDEPRVVRLSDFFAANRPGTKIVMLNAAAGWCGPCMAEASAMVDFSRAYEAKGVVVLTAVIQDQNGSPADPTFTRLWAETFRLSVPTIVDSSFETQKYFDIQTMPSNLFIDAETTDVLATATGAEPGSDPMRAYRDLLDHHLANR